MRCLSLQIRARRVGDAEQRRAACIVRESRAKSVPLPSPAGVVVPIHQAEQPLARRGFAVDSLAGLRLPGEMRGAVGYFHLETDHMTRPLEGITILDLTWVLAGPYASMVLCDLGADVIKVERPPWGDIARTTGPYQNGWSGYFFSINRGKRSIAIDLRKDEGRELFLRMAATVDVVMENFTPGTMDRLGIGYEALAARNPRLIFASTSGFGQTGPYRSRPALDIVVQGMGGIMSITGEPGRPPVRPGASYGDLVAGLYTTIGILSALHERNASGKGQAVDISMLDCQVSVLENAIMRYGVTGQPPGPLGTRHPERDAIPGVPHSRRLCRGSARLRRGKPVGTLLRHPRPRRPHR